MPKEKIKKVLINACKTLQNDMIHKFTKYPIGKKEKEFQKKLALIYYHRLDEIGLIYSKHFGVTFNQAIKELEIEEDLNDLKELKR
jgi:hypothetical protein